MNRSTDVKLTLVVRIKRSVNYRCRLVKTHDCYLPGRLPNTWSDSNWHVHRCFGHLSITIAANRVMTSSIHLSSFKVTLQLAARTGAANAANRHSLHAIGRGLHIDEHTWLVICCLRACLFCQTGCSHMLQTAELLCQKTVFHGAVQLQMRLSCI